MKNDHKRFKIVLTVLIIEAWGLLVLDIFYSSAKKFIFSLNVWTQTEIKYINQVYDSKLEDYEYQISLNIAWISLVWIYLLMFY